MSDNKINIEEEVKEAVHKAEDIGKRRIEEISVRGSELKNTIGRLGKEAMVRKITIKNQSGKTLAEIPLALGALGVLVIGPWTAVLLASAWLTRVSVLIEYEEAPSEMEEAAAKAVEQIETRIA